MPLEALHSRSVFEILNEAAQNRRVPIEIAFPIFRVEQQPSLSLVHRDDDGDGCLGRG